MNKKKKRGEGIITKRGRGREKSKSNEKQHILIYIITIKYR